MTISPADTLPLWSAGVVSAPSLAGARISILGIHFAPEPTGNAPYTTLMADALASAGATVTVFTGVPHYPQWRVGPPYRRGLRWVESRGDVHVRRYRHWVPKHPGTLGRAALDASFVAAAMRDLLRTPADALIAVTPALAPIAAALAARRGRPVGVVVQDLIGNSATQSGSTGARVGRMIAAAEYRLLAQCNLVGVITPQFGVVLVANGVDRSRLVDLPNCVHIAKSTTPRRETRHRLGWAEQRFYAVFTGSLGRKHGLDVLVDSARLLETSSPNVTLVVVGDGVERARLVSRATGLGNIKFIDPVSEQEYPDLLCAADLLLLTERAGVMEMSLPSKLTSYSSAARPIVASVEVNGITGSLLNSRHAALLTQPGNADELAAAIVRVQRSEHAAAELSTAARRLLTSDSSRDSSVMRYQRFACALLETGAGMTFSDAALGAGRVRPWDAPL